MDNFDKWNFLKKAIDERGNISYFKEREIWWSSLGKNIGIEIGGKNQQFSRPVLIVKKHNNKHCLVIPATTQKKSGKYYFYIEINNKRAYLITSQIRSISGKRLIKRISTISTDEFEKIKKAIIRTNF